MVDARFSDFGKSLTIRVVNCVQENKKLQEKLDAMTRAAVSAS